MQRVIFLSAAWLCTIWTLCIVDYDIEVTSTCTTECRQDILGSCRRRLLRATRLGLRRLQPEIVSTVVGVCPVLDLLLIPVYRCRTEKKVRAIGGRMARVVFQEVPLNAGAGLAYITVVSSLLESSRLAYLDQIPGIDLPSGQSSVLCGGITNLKRCKMTALWCLRRRKDSRVFKCWSK